MEGLNLLNFGFSFLRAPYGAYLKPPYLPSKRLSSSLIKSFIRRYFSVISSLTGITTVNSGKISVDLTFSRFLSRTWQVVPRLISLLIIWWFLLSLRAIARLEYPSLCKISIWARSFSERWDPLGGVVLVIDVLFSNCAMKYNILSLFFCCVINDIWYCAFVAFLFMIY